MFEPGKSGRYPDGVTQAMRDALVKAKETPGYAEEKAARQREYQRKYQEKTRRENGIPEKVRAEHRRCSICEEVLPLYLFNADRKDPSGVGYRCKECSRIRYLLYRKSEQGKAVIRENKAISRRRKAAIVNEYKAERGCLRCGEREVSCLDHHHVTPEDKSSNLSELMSRDASLATIRSELEKCVILCANCHRKLHANIWFLDSSRRPIEYIRDVQKEMAEKRKALGDVSQFTIPPYKRKLK